LAAAAAEIEAELALTAVYSRLLALTAAICVTRT
jgi:hypothetical protein